ncbi:MAG: multidrug efflux SMR transporter [Phycisphaerae bacterium]|nr:multidrug efflux SMR transporter [Phycisphaerae bacterium]
MAWVVLLLAAVFEAAWAVGLKFTDGFTRPVPTMVAGICMLVSTVLMALAAKTLPIGTAYAVWTGIAIVGAAVCGALLFGESLTLIRVMCIGLITVGIIGLRVFS